ncbi:hypothetical protein XTPLMG730_0842 [Xanthomonas translucens pv. phlei]|uniref:Uncharacterized protein n=1 Tax=Xanthomonas graminis pv. phlei TaxID=487906 RepID=A0A0K2ZK01_9XANT|nr:hypothetical protein XTPLMG730_0842 [Xanthomonas translucens pv. phlei]
MGVGVGRERGRFERQARTISRVVTEHLLPTRLHRGDLVGEPRLLDRIVLDAPAGGFVMVGLGVRRPRIVVPVRAHAQPQAEIDIVERHCHRFIQATHCDIGRTRHGQTCRSDRQIALSPQSVRYSPAKSCSAWAKACAATPPMPSTTPACCSEPSEWNSTELVGRSGALAPQQLNTLQYPSTGNPKALNAPHFEIPYPSADLLRQMRDDPTLRKILPTQED